MKQIYFLRPIGEGTPVKIGMSVNPESRLKTYAIWLPVVINVVASCRAHHNTEQFLHRHFIDDWMHGEWFAASDGLQDIIDHVAINDSLPDWVVQATPNNPGEYAKFRRYYPHGKTKLTRVSRVPHKIVRAS